MAVVHLKRHEPRPPIVPLPPNFPTVDAIEGLTIPQRLEAFAVCAADRPIITTGVPFVSKSQIKPKEMEVLFEDLRASPPVVTQPVIDSIENAIRGDRRARVIGLAILRKSGAELVQMWKGADAEVAVPLAGALGL